MGDGTIIIRDGTSIGTPDTYDGLNRDVTISQYNTKEGGLKGGFTINNNTVEFIAHPIETPGKAIKKVIGGINDAIDSTVQIYNEAGEIIDKTGNLIESGHYTTNDKVEYLVAIDKYEERIAAGIKLSGTEMLDYYNNKEAAGIELTIDEKSDREMLVYAEEQKALAEKQKALRSKDTELTTRILKKTGWDGTNLENNNNINVIDQSTSTLKKYGLPEISGACVFLSSVYGAADVLGVTLKPEDVMKIYYAAKENGSVCSKDNGTYGVNNYPLLVQTVADIKKIDASNITCPNEGILITDAKKDDVTKQIINTIKDGGSVQIRYAEDPSDPDSNAHTMRVTGSFIEDGKIILKIKDTNHPDVETFIDTSTYKLYTIDKNKKKTYSERPVYNFRPTTNVKKKGE